MDRLHQPQLLDRTAWDALRDAVSRGALPTDVREGIDDRARAAADAPIRTLMDRRAGTHRPTDDPHAYVSIATYFHPNPDTPDGLPWVSRDGVFSPDLHRYDRRLFDHAADTVKALGETAFVLDRQDLVDRLAEHVAAWMVDAATRMRPNLLNGQFIPGVNTGRWVGVIDVSTRMPAMLDAAGLVWPRLPQPVCDGMHDWCGQLLDWLIDGPYAADLLSPERNNHGTFFDRLVVCLALWLGRADVAAERLARFVPDRLMTQVEPDGAQPHELGRTLSWNYTVMNAIGLLDLAKLAGTLGPSALNAGEPGHDRLRAVVAFLVPYLIGEREWTLQQIKPIAPLRAWPVVAVAERCFGYAGLVARWCEAQNLPAEPWLGAWLGLTQDAHPMRK